MRIVSIGDLNHLFLFAVGVLFLGVKLPAGPVEAPLSSPTLDMLSRAELAVRADEVEAGSDAERQVLLEWSERLLGLDDREHLLEVMDRLYATFPRDPEVRRRCGLVWIQTADWARLEPLIEALRKSTDTPVETLREGVEAARENRLFDSLLLLQAAHRAAPDDPRILLNLGSFYCRFGRCEDGLALFREITAKLPDDPVGHLAVAKAAKTLRDFEAGTNALNKVEAIVSANPRYGDRFSAEIESLWQSFIEMDTGSVSAEE